MKKWIACLLVFCLTLALASCAAGGEETTAKPGSTETTGTDATSAKPIEKEVSAEAVANALASCEPAKKHSGGEPLNVSACATSGKLFGLTEEVSGYRACYKFSPPIFPSSLLGLVFEVKDGTDVETFKADVLSKADKGYNVCMGVESALCESAGNYVLLIMLNGGEEAAKPYFTVFHEAVGE